MERGKDKRLLEILSLEWKVLLEKCNNSFIDRFDSGFELLRCVVITSEIRNFLIP